MITYFILHIVHLSINSYFDYHEFNYFLSHCMSGFTSVIILIIFSFNSKEV